MIVIIDNLGSFTYNLYQIITKFYSPVKVINHQKVILKDLKKIQPTAIMISSGPGLPEENPIVLEIVREFAPKVPILGISFGHLAIAEFFGAKIEPVERFDHGKSIQVMHHQEDLFAEMPNPFKAGCYHAFIVSKTHLPQDLKILAETKEGVIMSIRHREYPCFGVQFHPETVLTPEGYILIKTFIQGAKKSKTQVI